ALSARFASSTKPTGRSPHWGSRAKLAYVRTTRPPLPTTIRRVPHHVTEPNSIRQTARQNDAANTASPEATTSVAYQAVAPTPSSAAPPTIAAQTVVAPS